MNNTSLEHRRILVVDDEQFNLDLMWHILTAVGCSQVTCESNSQLALQHFEEGEFDLVLLDVQMPGMNGVEFLARAKKMQKPNDPVFIFVTGYPTQELKIQAERLGAHSIVSKPFEATKFVDLVANL